MIPIDTTALAEEIRRLLKLSIGDNDSSDFQDAIRQLIALLRQCGEALQMLHEGLIVSIESDKVTYPKGVNKDDPHYKQVTEALGAMELIINDKKNLDSSTE